MEREIRERTVPQGTCRATGDLRESEERLALAIQATQLGMFDFLPKTRKLVCSERTKRHFGLAAGAKVDCKTVLRSLHSDDRECFHKTIHNAASSWQ